VLSEVDVKEPRIPVYSNVTGKPFESPEAIIAMLPRQLVEPVQWESTLKNMYAAGKKEMFELGPGQQIKAMTKRISPDLWKGFRNVAA
jgi:[acyl-carrier-protein] S-malonyltransferase